MATALQIAVYVTGLLVCGSLNTITLKISFTLTSVGITGEKKLFQKPWFNTLTMFLAMMLALFFDRSLRRCEPCAGGKLSGAQVPLVADASPGGTPGDGKVERKSQKSWLTKVGLVSMPAVFDILATGLCSMGFLYIPASVWQLLRGAEMIFAAIFAVFCLRRRLEAFHWLGLFFCVLGIVAVGLASVWGSQAPAGEGHSDEPDTQSGTGLLLLGISLALGGQVVQAAQVVAEEWLLTDLDLPEMQIIGFEGVWGAAIMLVTVFPLLYALPGSDNGHFEDEADTWVMMQHSSSLLSLLAVYTVSCATYNMAGIAVTGALSAVHRVMIEALRTCLVWAFGLIVHYVYDENSRFGESWTSYSWLEVAGFGMLILGQATYGAMIKIPGLTYPAVETAQVLASPGSLRNLASPLPPPRPLEMGLDVQESPKA